MPAAAAPGDAPYILPLVSGDTAHGRPGAWRTKDTAAAGVLGGPRPQLHRTAGSGQGAAATVHSGPSSWMLTSSRLDFGAECVNSPSN